MWHLCYPCSPFILNIFVSRITLACIALFTLEVETELNLFIETKDQLVKVSELVVILQSLATRVYKAIQYSITLLSFYLFIFFFLSYFLSFLMTMCFLVLMCAVHCDAFEYCRRGPHIPFCLIYLLLINFRVFTMVRKSEHCQSIAHSNMLCFCLSHSIVFFKGQVNYW